MQEIDIHRAAIDKIDDELVVLLNKRMRSVKAIGILKQTDGTSVYRPEREREILDRLKQLNEGPLNDAAIEAVFFEIFAVSRNLEMPEKVAFLGPKGSYTHQVAQSRFGSMGNYLSLSSIEAVFRVLANKEAKYGVVPIENNTEGAVGETLDCLGFYDGVKIVAEIYMDIHHSLATRAESVEKIEKIYSHPQGYNQCRKFLEEHQMLDIEFIPTQSTAGAAQKAASDPNSAAICSHIGAKMYNVPILFGKIEDNLANKTRFLILSDFKNRPGSQNKTSILARTDDKPGGLVEFLQSFEKERVNLTKIESRPAKEKGFKTIFYLDFEGHIDEKRVQKVLNRNQKYQIKWLGSYIVGD